MSNVKYIMKAVTPEDVLAQVIEHLETSASEYRRSQSRAILKRDQVRDEQRAMALDAAASFFHSVTIEKSVSE